MPKLGVTLTKEKTMTFTTDTTQYQEFIAGSSFHGKSMDALVAPIEEALDLLANWTHELRDANTHTEACNALHHVKQLLPLVYVALGLCGEAGEFADKVKKLIRDGQGAMTEERHTGLLKELGDVEWYATDAARVLGSDKDKVIGLNYTKLMDRFGRGKQSGSGDDR